MNKANWLGFRYSGSLVIADILELLVFFTGNIPGDMPSATSLS
ncbi:MAG: hypothetical protein R2828_03190 [Saprospiraceae bacterium]